MALPFLKSEEGKERWIRERAEAAHALLGKPIEFSLHVSEDGTRVSVPTYREGGGDEFALRLIGKQWRFVRSYWGGAC